MTVTEHEELDATGLHTGCGVSALTADWNAYSAYTGMWVDRSGSFYGGSKIQITDDAWKPINPQQRVHQTATFRHRLTDTGLQLIEIRASGAERVFRANRVSSTLQVHLDGLDSPLTWKLSQVEQIIEDPPELREKNSFRKTWILIGLSLLLFLLGVCTFCLMSGYDVVTGTYLVMQIVTTVGFGDVPVHTAHMKLFMVLYILLCVPISAYAMNMGIQYMLKKSAENVRSLMLANGQQTQQADRNVPLGIRLERQARYRHRRAIRRVLVSFAAFFGMVALGTAYFSIMEACTCSYDQFMVDGCVDATYESCVDSGGYRKSWLDNFYMCVVMLTTVGFGDVSPRSFLGRAFCSIYATVGCLTTARCMSELTRFFFEKDEARRPEYDARISEHVFAMMDLDHKGYISRSDFVNYMLVTHNLVKQSELDAIIMQFDEIDTNKSDEVAYC